MIFNYLINNVIDRDNYVIIDRLREIIIPNSIGNCNALVGFVGCIKIPACAGMTAVLMDSVYGSVVEEANILYCNPPTDLYP